MGIGYEHKPNVSLKDKLVYIRTYISSMCINAPRLTHIREDNQYYCYYPPDVQIVDCVEYITSILEHNNFPVFYTGCMVDPPTSEFDIAYT